MGEEKAKIMCPVDPPAKRGTAANPENRYERIHVDFDAEIEDDGTPPTLFYRDVTRTILARNDSPDIGFQFSLNPYRGCEHGCIYCYARPSHAYLNLSPGLDFETRIFAKVNAAERLLEELGKPSYICETISLGANTDPYQPAEREWKLTRGILEVASQCRQPVGIVSKSALVERDLDLLAPMAEKGLVAVFISVTTLDHSLARRMEPRASAPARRIEAIRRLSQAGVPVGVMVAPIVPFLTDAEMEHILEVASEAGAVSAGYILMRLPFEVKTLFRDWLEQHYPLKAAHVMSRVQAMRGGRDNDPNFGSRMCGTGELADMLRARFEMACKRLGLNENRRKLDTSQFRRPGADRQNSLF